MRRIVLALLLVALLPPAVTARQMTCGNFVAQEDAQAVYEANVRNGYGDRFGLDEDGDGIACEG